ncbi:SPOR domain-containing protein [Stutzerimonas stutzeri]|uniref:SPOR domain-containing protein n=1 Tax=Stutzerimonas stutzeri TaxID=316 RepID=UPI0015E46338|nr:SPOR domain-containing protein [Stutzerimonas stutzeri]MBA1261533.1 SPOR domain-containing protein [Stutzerimonas stutzeri]
MRWLLLLLILFNLFYYLHNQQRVPWGAQELPVPVTATPDPGIRLLSESNEPGRRIQPARAAEDSVCLFLGGFDDESLAVALRQRLLSLDIASTLQGIDATSGVDYWVYLPPLVSRQASLRQLRELQSRNIDSYIITVGDLSNGISLGIFSRKDSAESVVGRLQGLDYSALIRELPRAHRKYWVRVESQSRHHVDDQLLLAMVRDFSDLQRRQMPCASVATSE